MASKRGLTGGVVAPQAGAGSSTGVVGSGGAGGLQNLIRAYQVRGHEAAELDPLKLHAWRKWTEKAAAIAKRD